jgi:colicin import membrane protein
MRKAATRGAWVCGAAWLGLLATVALAAPVDQEAERARIKQERAQAEARFKEQEQACLTRFLVTPCTDEAKRVRREALASLRQQENLLDDEHRKQRAADRAQALADKASQKRHDIALPPGPAASAQGEVDGASPPASSAHRAAPQPGKAMTPAQAEGLARQRAADQAAKAAEASHRAQAQRQKLEAAARRKAEVEKRNAEQAQSAKPASPGLPTPASKPVPPGTPPPAASAP